MFNSIFGVIDPVAFDLGFATITWYALLILLGFCIAIALSAYEGKKLGIKPNVIIDLGLYGLPIAIIGARLWYVIFEFDKYSNDLIGIFKINEGGLAIHGGFLAAVVYGYVFSRIYKVSYLLLVDLAAAGFLIAQTFGRWGNFINQEAHGGMIKGTITEQKDFLSGTLHLPDFIVDQMYINGPDGLGYYHPTFLYESIWNIVGFGIVLLLRRTKLLYIGELMLFYLIWYGTGRYFIEGLRTDSLYIGPFRTAQLISLLFVVAGVAGLILRRVYNWRRVKYFDVIEENNQKILAEYEAKMNENESVDNSEDAVIEETE